MKIYLASSWRNKYYNGILKLLQKEHYHVYDFRANGFSWTSFDKNWENWDVMDFWRGLQHPVAEKGFNKDFYAMRNADACVLVLPSGRSSHLEAGYFVGAGKSLLIYLPETIEAELMYRMANSICTNQKELLLQLKNAEWRLQIEKTESN